MTANASSDPTAANAGVAASPVIAVPDEETAIYSRIDFAKVAGKQFLVYGWVLGFANSVQNVAINLGDVVIDLSKQGIVVHRPDVAKHFSLSPGNDEHGFYALVPLPDGFSFVDDLVLSVTLPSGQTIDSLWPVSCSVAKGASAIGPHLATLNHLLPNLTREEANRLIEFARPALGFPIEAAYVSSLPPPVRFEIDLCCVLDNRILVVLGWRFDPANELTLAELRIGESAFSLLEDSVPFAHAEVNPEPSLYRKRDAERLAGFSLVHQLPSGDANTQEALVAFAVRGATEQRIFPVCQVANEAREKFLSTIAKMEANSALLLIDQVTAVLDNGPEERPLGALLELIRRSTIERLPSSIQHANPRYSLHVDHVIPVADKGIFLTGWFNSEPTAAVRIECHCGSSLFAVSDHWSRHVRADVASHLTSAGIQLSDHDVGFLCYVPLSSGGAPYYLLAKSESGESQRMVVTVPESAESALHTVRALATSFHSGHPQLRFLMDHHVGPAVGAAWAGRHRTLQPPTVRNFGSMPVDPKVSIIVPLYGRHDFAEYQMALMADDPEFQRVELIYVVDDPAILVEFTGMCAELYGMYNVPFIVASSGTNLGFAGACNLGSRVSRGQYLLFLNSDVLPKRPRWVSDLLRIYKSLPSPGVLGAKLLYEDGSLQHAGIAFIRHLGWANMWANDHPLKGQSPLGLEGVREADAVTAACVLIDAALFRQLGGFSEDYIIGDFEDSDLCLRLISAGMQNYVALDVELFHLERQSQNRVGDGAWRTNLTLYNCWLHNGRWGELIERRARPLLEEARDI
jgi:GT2 family glycosyltransferase